MKQLIYTLGLFFMGMCLVMGQTQTENYIKTTTYRVKTSDGTTNSSGATLTADDKVEGITYHDGLGRPIQSVVKQSGGQKQDIITPMVYDGYGRQSQSYLPYAQAYQGAADPLSYRDANTLMTDLDAFYLSRYPQDLNAAEINAYSQTLFEASPLNRTLEQSAPGKDWSLSNGHTIKFEYDTNASTDKLPKYRVIFPTGDTEAPLLMFNGFYDPQTLYKTLTKDENWNASQQYVKDHTTEEYKDKQGRVILKRTYHEGITHDTQYVYDDFGNLSYVLSPKGSDFVLSKVKYNSSTTPFSFADLASKQVKGVNGTGGGSIEVDANTGEITVNFNLTFNSATALHNGPIKLINSNLPNMVIGTISGPGYSYVVSILEEYLYLSGSGSLTSLDTTIVTDIPAFAVDNTALEDLCYQYRYDHRNRLVEKKIPQKGWEYIIYDVLDRPVLTQDANLRASKHWLFTKYDAFGRVLYTGQILNLDDDRKTFQGRVNTQTVRHETPTGSLNYSIAGYPMYYTNNALQFPNAAISYTDLYSINYYDSYNGQLTAVATDPGTVYGVNTTANTKTLATGSRVKVLDGTGSHWVTSVSYYDDKARPIYAASYNSLLGTTDVLKSELDFTGLLIQSESTHTKGGTTIIVHDGFTYDHAARLLTQVQTINSGTPELIVNNHYDELGQLISKDVGGTVATNPSLSNGLQSVDYGYNIRGWLKTINDLENLGNDLFGFKLKL